ncbi:hypothetical protein GCM10029978_066180 [Actinoallomurus acanthiterrae]
MEEEVERADAAHREARAEQRGLRERQAEVADHLATCESQLCQRKKERADILSSAERFLLAAWAGHLDACAPPTDTLLANTLTSKHPLELPADVTTAIQNRTNEVLAAIGGMSSHRDIMTRLEAYLGVTVTVTAGRNEHTRARVDGADASLDTHTRTALKRYHEQAANVDLRRARDSEEREVGALDAAIAALRGAVERQAQALRSALERAQSEHTRLQREYDAAYDEVHATDAHLRNLQRSLEHQVRGLFTRVSQRFNEIRYRDGGCGGELGFEITPPSLDVPEDNQPTNCGWILQATPRWARRPPDNGQPEHVPYHEQANTAQYKLATIQLVLAALLANDDPIGRLLILDELGDGLGEAHRERVLDALRRAAEETGITVLATVQDDIQHEAFARCSEVLLLRYQSTTDLLNEPTYMFAGDIDGGRQETLIPLADVLTDGRGPGWSSLLTVYNRAAEAQAAHRRSQDHAD